ncbi:hypothetical protein SAMN05443633_103185 [Chryseobacterium arachidis]|uniref:Bacteriocin-type signal sequence-containing protein n=1 Tax=Chryseobacterium arachidis TaxID=1416778 RepID=A0A1M4ZJT9_9FLAO|nr:hypothetical protein [Chryseobacterium arachidis]SHF18340.1 hypothetical protein SAMN05443633_103185 [Chryseobacterium arachidis]
MKNLKKLNRQDLKVISGGTTDQCQVDADCGAVGCAVCVTIRGAFKTCMFVIDPQFC